MESSERENATGAAGFSGRASAGNAGGSGVPLSQTLLEARSPFNRHLQANKLRVSD